MTLPLYHLYSAYIERQALSGVGQSLWGRLWIWFKPSSFKDYGFDLPIKRNHKDKNRSKYTCEIYITNWYYSNKVVIVFAMYQRIKSKETSWDVPPPWMITDTHICSRCLFLSLWFLLIFWLCRVRKRDFDIPYAIFPKSSTIYSSMKLGL